MFYIIGIQGETVAQHFKSENNHQKIKNLQCSTAMMDLLSFFPHSKAVTYMRGLTGFGNNEHFKMGSMAVCVWIAIETLLNTPRYKCREQAR